MSVLLALLSGAPSGITGSGALVAGAATVAGVGLSSSDGTGALAAGAATAAGVGLSSSIGSGALVSASATVAGEGTVASDVITGTGALVAQSATAAGVGLSSSEGTGALVAAAASVSGVGASSSAGTGALAAQAAAIASVGIVQWLAGSGDVYLLENGTDRYLTEDGASFYRREEIALGGNVAVVAGVGISESTGTGDLIVGASAVAYHEPALGGGAGVPIRSYVVGRKRWREIQEAIAAEREAAQRANELPASDRKVAQGAIEQAAQAITAVKETHQLPAELEDMTAALEAAASARTTAEVLRQVQFAADYAQAVIAELYQEEEEAIMLLLAA